MVFSPLRWLALPSFLLCSIFTMARSRLSFYIAFMALSLCYSPAINAQEQQSNRSSPVAKTAQLNHPAAHFDIALSPENAKQGDEVTLAIRVQLQKGWHLGALAQQKEAIGFPTEIDFNPVGLEALDAHFTSNTEPTRQTLDVGTQLLMDGEFTWTRRYQVVAPNADFGGAGSIRFQACNDKTCLPPKKLPFTLGVATRIASTAPEPAPSTHRPPSETTIGEPMVIPLEKCALTRTRPQIGNIATLLMFGRGSDAMVWKATIPSGPDQGIQIYLPKARKYSLTNTGSDGTIVSNTSTYVSIDQNEDGTLSEWEATATDRPIRIRNSMYRITDIDPKNTTLTLQQLDMPLRGSLVGFRCPDFEFTALDGSKISNRSILGKTTVLDIWAVSCHNCYEGFPKLQKCLDKHGTDNLQVILLTVDESLEMYQSQAPRLFETYGGGNWPQVMIPGGFNGALILGDYGFGSTVVDADGIVRAVGVLGFNAESTLDEVLRRSTK